MPIFLPFRRAALAGAIASIPLALQAQTQNVGTLDPVVVTPSRIPQLERDVPGDVTVIGREELDRAGQNSLADVLARQPGFSVAASGGPHTQTSVFLRGTNPQQTLVMIDGVRINSISSNAVNWNTIDPAAIERVEIVRGAASSLYGSNAIGGVINVITRKGRKDQPPEGWMNFGAGSYGTVKSGVGVSGAADGFDYSLAANMVSSDGFNATLPNNTFEHHKDDDGYTQHTLSAALGYEWAPQQRLDVTAYNGYVNGQFDAGEFSPQAYSQTRQQTYSLASTNQLTEAWQSVLRFGFAKESAVSHSFGSDYTFGNLSRSYLWQNNVTLSENHDVSVLLERLEERTSPGSMSYTKNARNTNAAGLVYRGQLGSHRVQASLRNDNISGYGNETTGGLSYELELNPNWRAGLAANTGFRAPTFADLYSPRSAWFVGNPDLAPERSRNMEASLAYESEETRVKMVLFQNKIKDMIDGYVFDNQLGTNTAKNIDRATLRGLSLTAEQTLGNTSFSAGADLLSPRNDNPSATAQGDQLRLRARQTYRLAALHRIDALTLGAEFQYTGKRYNDADNTERLGGYSLTNLTASYALSRHASVQLRWDNIFNKDYVAMTGYRTPGSNVFVNLSLRM